MTGTEHGELGVRTFYADTSLHTLLPGIRHRLFSVQRRKLTSGRGYRCTTPSVRACVFVRIRGARATPQFLSSGRPAHELLRMPACIARGSSGSRSLYKSSPCRLALSRALGACRGKPWGAVLFSRSVAILTVLLYSQRFGWAGLHWRCGRYRGDLDSGRSRWRHPDGGGRRWDDSDDCFKQLNNFHGAAACSSSTLCRLEFISINYDGFVIRL